MNQRKLQDVYVMFDFITLNDMLQHTPNADIEDCMYRDVTGNHVLKSREKSCVDFFDVKKFIVQQYTSFVVRVKERSFVRFQSH